MRAIPAGPAEARPGPPASDLMGRQPVRVRAEGTDLVAYGFGNQRIVIPVASIGSVVAHATYKGVFWTHGPALLVRDAHQRTLLRAHGTWGVYGDLKKVCDSLTLPPPELLSSYGARRSHPGAQRAPGCRELRTRPRGFTAWVMALCLLCPTALGLGIFAGIRAALALPPAIGAVRTLIAVAGGTVGGFAGLWLLARAVAAGLAAIRWSAFSLRAHAPAPPGRFFRRDRRPGTARKLGTTAMVLAVPALIGWGPGVGIATLVHGFSDQALVAQLRQQGVPAPGLVFDDPTWTTDSNGNLVVHHHATLDFRDQGTTVIHTPDPAIGGRTWPIDENKLVTVVYDPASPQTAAVRQQILGSPWHGAPTGNLISGALLTAALPVLSWTVVRRIRTARRAGREELLDGIW